MVEKAVFAIPGKTLFGWAIKICLIPNFTLSNGLTIYYTGGLYLLPSLSFFSNSI